MYDARPGCCAGAGKGMTFEAMIDLLDRLRLGAAAGVGARRPLHGMYVQLTPTVNGVYVLFMREPVSTRFEMRAPIDWLRLVDDWRRKQPDLPARAEAIRRLVEKGLASE